jgi:hypothetical protein
MPQKCQRAEGLNAQAVPALAAPDAVVRRKDDHRYLKAFIVVVKLACRAIPVSSVPEMRIVFGRSGNLEELPWIARFGIGLRMPLGVSNAEWL